MARASAGLVADVAAEASPAYSALGLAVPGGFDLTSIGGTSIRERDYSAWQTFNKFGPPPIFDGYVCVLRGSELFSPLVGQRLRSASSIQPKPLLGHLNMLWSWARLVIEVDTEGAAKAWFVEIIARSEIASKEIIADSFGVQGDHGSNWLSVFPRAGGISGVLGGTSEATGRHDMFEQLHGVSRRPTYQTYRRLGGYVHRCVAFT
jgi:hypothetical protein